MVRALVAACLVAPLLALTTAAGAEPSSPQSGDADPTWSAAPLPGVSLAVATPDGDLVVVTTKGLVRLMPSGAIDASYGTSGFSPVPFTPTWIGASAAASDVGAGTAGSDVILVGQKGNDDMAARVLPTGQLDPSFGHGGVVDTNIFGQFPYVDGSGRLLLESATPLAVERLNGGGVPDASFGAGGGIVLPGATPGPLVSDLLGGGYVVAPSKCAASAPCGFDLVTLSDTGTVVGSVTAATAGAPFNPQVISNHFQLGGGAFLVLGKALEELVNPDGSLVGSYGQARCGEPIGTPTMASGTLYPLADGRTVDLTTPVATSYADFYDIAPHVFVRVFGHKDSSFGDGGHLILPTFNGATFLTSTDDAMWIGLSSLASAQPTTITKILLGPDRSPQSYAPPATFGDWVISSNGSTLPVAPIFGDGVALCGSATNVHLAQPIVGAAGSPDGVGYWLVARDGGIFNYGDSQFLGSTGAMHLNAPIVGMAATPDGQGYWLVARDGGIFNFGDAPFFGSTGATHLNAPIVGMAPTADGQGYWLVASDGGVFSFGDARFLGSAGGAHLNAPVVGMLRTRSGRGYWLAASDGGIFTYGDAGYGDVRADAPIVGIAPGPPDTFTVVNAAGQVYNSDYGHFPQPLVPSSAAVGIISAG